MMAAVAAGAFTASGQTITAPVTSHEDATSMAFERLSFGSDAAVDPTHRGAQPGAGHHRAAPDVFLLARSADAGELQGLARGTAIAEQVADAAALTPAVVAPTAGIITSSFGPRWGTTHYGLDVANDIGTPILAVMDGVVVDSGPASGFGLWVRLVHDDGTVTVYGHIDRTLVEEGQRVRAGDQIADMGNRGFSTGPHLHFEVRSADGEKLSPQEWLEERDAMTGITG